MKDGDMAISMMERARTRTRLEDGKNFLDKNGTAKACVYHGSMYVCTYSTVQYIRCLTYIPTNINTYPKILLSISPANMSSPGLFSILRIRLPFSWPSQSYVSPGMISVASCARRRDLRSTTHMPRVHCPEVSMRMSSGLGEEIQFCEEEEEEEEDDDEEDG